MTLQFPDIGTFALIDGAWQKVTSDRWSAGRPVTVVVGDRETFEAFRPSGEVAREWLSDRGAVRVTLSSVDEIVHVRREGRYRGEPVIRLGKVVDGAISVGLVVEDPGTAARLDFDGDGRIESFTKRIDPEELTDVVERVQVVYRRDEGAVDG